MKRVVVIMNTDRVGGAERSLLIQLIAQKDNNYHFLIPRVSDSKQLENLIKSYGLNQVDYFNYPKSIYNLSRSSCKINFALMKDLVSSVFKQDDFKVALSADIVYLNGVKAAFLFFLKNNILGFDKKVIWHFRDYWYQGHVLNFAWKIINNIKPKNLQLVCNSHSTLESLEHSPWKNSSKTVIYNPSGLPEGSRKSRPVKTLGFVSMLAPWKGIHEVVLWTKLYEKELIELGIEQIKFYGADLYVTDGVHVGYAKQLNQLMEKIQSKLISFEGQQEPSEIFKNIDCLIHYSLDPEPFGRVIIEAFHFRVPTISTSLGGAAELILDDKTGIKVKKYDKQGLFKAVKKIVKDDQFRKMIIENAFNSSIDIEKNIDFKMHQVLEEVAI